MNYIGSKASVAVMSSTNTERGSVPKGKSAIPMMISEFGVALLLLNSLRGKLI